MPEPASLIMLQFLAWVADRPRTYAATMEAWHSTCPGYRCGRTRSSTAWCALITRPAVRSG
jgi:hypothetical protein